LQGVADRKLAQAIDLLGIIDKVFGVEVVDVL